jgi:hypothetical protein
LLIGPDLTLPLAPALVELLLTGPLFRPVLRKFGLHRGYEITVILHPALPATRCLLFFGEFFLIAHQVQ